MKAFQEIRENNSVKATYTDHTFENNILLQTLHVPVRMNLTKCYLKLYRGGVHLLFTGAVRFQQIFAPFFRCSPACSAVVFQLAYLNPC